MKFYTIGQNNSGGYHIQNEFVDYLVCVQSSNPENATNLLEKITESYSEYCECCGKRWYISLDENDGTNYISSAYGENLENIKFEDVYHYASVVIIYYANGDKKRFNVKTKEFTDLGKWI